MMAGADHGEQGQGGGTQVKYMAYRQIFSAVSSTARMHGAIGVTAFPTTSNNPLEELWV